MNSWHQIRLGIDMAPSGAGAMLLGIVPAPEDTRLEMNERNRALTR
jgi:hypothetical protein